MTKTKNKLRVLLAGHISRCPSGSTLLFQQLVDMLQKNDAVEIQVINTSRPTHLTTNWLINLAVAVKVTVAVLLRLRKIQVVTFHASRQAIMSYGPILFWITRIFKKPLVLRLFGGTLEKEYEALSPVRRWVFDKTIIAADLFVVETKQLVKYFERLADNIKWLPNSTKLADLSYCKEFSVLRCKRYIFLGLIKETKGIDIILDSVPHLMPEISVDLFGPLEGKFTCEYISSKGKGVVCYKGVLTPAQVYDELFKYDAIILPTFYEGEGYPAVIVEAYSHGLPVIATRWRSIPEIVEEDTGILIPPRSSEALAKAMNRLHTDTALYAKLKQGVLSKRLEFSDTYWADRFVGWCKELACNAKRT